MITTLWTALHAATAACWTWAATAAHVLLCTTPGQGALAGAVVAATLVYAIVLARGPSDAQRAGRSWLTADDGADYSRPLGDFTDLDTI
jgi:hypothetical protein